jgi:hypothetical protein
MRIASAAASRPYSVGVGEPMWRALQGSGKLAVANL